MSDFATWLHDRFQQAGHTTEHADEHILVARTIGFGPTELAHLADITGASTTEINERARRDRADRDQNAPAGETDLEMLAAFRLLKAIFPDRPE